MGATWRNPSGGCSAPMPEAVAGRAFNCSDIVVQTRDIVGAVQRIAGVTGPLPEAAPAPTT